MIIAIPSGQLPVRQRFTNEDSAVLKLEQPNKYKYSSRNVIQRCLKTNDDMNDLSDRFKANRLQSYDGR
jgi:hypothetical protein